MSQEVISLNYPVNLNHRSLQPDQREAFLSEDLNTMVESIEVPATISVCAEDLLVLSKEAPTAWNTILTNPNIRVASSFYTHSLNELFPEETVHSVALSDKVMKTLLPPGKIAPFGFPPELSVPTPGTLESIGKAWSGTVFWDNRAGSESDKKLPNYFTTEEGLDYCVAVRDLAWRKVLHAFLREVVDADSVVDALHHDIAEQGTDSPLVARIDLETPVLNAVYGNDAEGLPRTDKFVELQDRLKRSGMKFVTLGEDDVDRGALPVIAAPVSASDALSRWANLDLRNQVKGEFSQTKTPYERALYLSSICSDYYMVYEDDVVLPATHNGKSGATNIRCDGDARAYELQRKFLALRNGEQLNAVPNPMKDPYLSMVHQAMLQTVEIIQSSKVA